MSDIGCCHLVLHDRGVGARLSIRTALWSWRYLWEDVLEEIVGLLIQVRVSWPAVLMWILV